MRTLKSGWMDRWMDGVGVGEGCQSVGRSQNMRVKTHTHTVERKCVCAFVYNLNTKF